MAYDTDLELEDLDVTEQELEALRNRAQGRDGGYEDYEREMDDLRREEEGERREERRATFVRVRFTVSGGKVAGRVIDDPRGRTKIVFPARSWIGEQPHDGEEIAVRIVHETKTENPRLGVLFVVRDLPRVDRTNYNGAHYAKCRHCGEWKVRVMPPLVGPGPHKVTRLLHPVCEACGTMHERCWP